MRCRHHRLGLRDFHAISLDLLNCRRGGADEVVDYVLGATAYLDRQVVDEQRGERLVHRTDGTSEDWTT